MNKNKENTTFHIFLNNMKQNMNKNKENTRIFIMKAKEPL